MTELTILMPCLNEAETLAVCIKKAKSFLAESGISGEVLIADNGSTDGSIEIASSLGAKVVHVPVRGYGAALLAGIQAASGTHIVMGDSDDSYDFTSLSLFVDEMRSGAGLVMGNRFKGGIADGAMPFLHRYLGNPVLSFLGRLFFNVPIGDFHCGLRGFNRESILSLNLQSPGMEFASEMVVKAKLHDLKIVEVPTTLSVDGRTRPPHLQTWSDGWRHLKFLLMHSPRWLFLYPGITCIAIGLMLVLSLMSGPLAISSGIHLDIHSLVLGCVLILIGTQSSCFSIIARRHAAQTGMLPTSEEVRRWLSIFSMERLLVVAFLLLLTGVLGIFYGVWTWAEQNFGDLEYASLIRPLLLSGTVVVVSLQLIFTSFLAEIVSGGYLGKIKND